jgi:DNA polymerase-1
MTHMADIGYFDIETADADRLYTGGHVGPFVRLCGAAGDGATGATTDPAKLLSFLDRAATIVGHNVFRFDLPALARHCGADYDALAAKTVDTAVLARLADPPSAKGMKRGHYSLDAVAARYGVAGKSDDLKALADEFGGYDKIPADDPRYIAYLHGDLRASRAVFGALAGNLTDYARREMRVAAIQNRMTLNGWRIDEPLLAERVAAEEDRRQQALKILGAEYGIPLTKTVSRGRGANKVLTEEPVKAPLATTAGQSALVSAFQAAGAPFYPRTATGALATSSDALGEGFYFVGKGANAKKLPGMLRAYGHLPEVRRICGLVGEVTGATAKYAEIAKFVTNGRVHGIVGEDQASGRWAYKRPSTTNMGKRGGKVVQRAVYLADEGHVLIAADFAQVDMRALAALSQDPAYMALFLPGKDAHGEIALQVFGDIKRREDAKPIGHGWNYGRSVRAISESTDIPLADVERFDRSMTERFPLLCAWRDRVREQGAAGQLIDNGFGRMMKCDPARAWTQAPALAGQGCARDIMTTGLLRMVERLPDITAMFRAVVHDEVVLSVRLDRVDEVTEVLRDAMTFDFRGVPILADVSAPGLNWAACYSGK